MISEISTFGLAPGLSAEKIAEPLVLEVIRAGHFPNDKIPRTKIKVVERIMEKYIYILKNNPLEKRAKVTPSIKKKINLYNWITEIAACEIEELLAPPTRQAALIDFMAHNMIERIKLIPKDFISEDEKNIQVYIAIYRTLFQLDNSYISYALLKTYWPNWKKAPQELVAYVAENLFSVQEKMESDLEHPIGNKFFSLCEKYDTVFLILGDILDSYAQRPKEAVEDLHDEKKMVKKTEDAYNKRLATLRRRLMRAAVYSTLSIFVAGGLSLFIFEIPLAHWVYGTWRPLAIVVDLMLPTILMGVLVALIRTPKKGNLERLVKEIFKVAYRQRKKDVYEIVAPRKKNDIFKVITFALYTLGAVLSLILIFLMFSVARVPVTSLYIDTLNVAMVVFAALVIRHRAKELTIVEKPTFWEFSLDILSVPVAKMGQWLANKWREYNIVSVFLTALVDMPFSNFVQFIENWRFYLNERKAEIH